MINWYPGHMARAKRLLQDQIKRIDLIIEICDARAPFASRNPDLQRMIVSKRHILLMNKSDLADPSANQAWLSYFRNQGTKAYQTDAVKLRGKETLNLIDRETEEIRKRAMNKGVRKTIRAMIVGIPNVGKSTLINHLNGRSVARIGDRPGVTQSNQWVRVSPYLELLDTPGILWPRLEDQLSARRLCYIGSIKDDVVDLYELTIHLLEELCDLVPESVSDRFRLNDLTLRGTALLDAVCVGRGWLLKGAQYDYDRCCNVVLNEFRAGKLGRITFETPPQEKMNHD